MGKDSNAFTLLEMIVVLAILSLLLGVILINCNVLISALDKQSLNTQCAEILQELLAHKNHGIMEGSTKKVYLFKDKLYIKSIKDVVITEKISLRDNLTITSNTYNGKFLEMKPMGTVNCGGHITFETVGGDKMTIVVQIGSGRIYLKDGGP